MIHRGKPPVAILYAAMIRYNTSSSGLIDRPAVIAGRKVRTPQGGVVGNAHRP